VGKIYLIKCYKNDDDWSEIVIDPDIEEIYKIGFTRGKPENRLKSLSTGNPHKMEIIKVFETKFNTKLEANLHNMFKSKRINNEWFMLNVDDVDGFLNICKTVEEQYDFMSENNYHFRKLLNIKEL